MPGAAVARLEAADNTSVITDGFCVRRNFGKEFWQGALASGLGEFIRKWWNEVKWGYGRGI
jgi:hypothetical protein